MENYFRMNLTKQEIDAISNLGLAHMGDCVFEILCRGYLCAKGETTVDRLHRDTISLVKATSQAKFVDKLLPLLTEEETALLPPGEKRPRSRGAQVGHPGAVRQGHGAGGTVRGIVSGGTDRPAERAIPPGHGGRINGF